MNIVARPWEPQDLIDDLQMLIDEEPINYLNGRCATLCMARDYLKEHFAEPRWISVEERLPDESMYGKEFIVAIKNRFNESHTATMYWWGENQQAKVWTVWHDVTHWMPLPEPPEDGDGNG